MGLVSVQDGKNKKRKTQILLIYRALSGDSSVNYQLLKEKNQGRLYFGIMVCLGNLSISSVLK